MGSCKTIGDSGMQKCLIIIASLHSSFPTTSCSGNSSAAPPNEYCCCRSRKGRVIFVVNVSLSSSFLFGRRDQQCCPACVEDVQEALAFAHSQSCSGNTDQKGFTERC